MTNLPNMVFIDYETDGAQLPNGKMDEENQTPVEVVAVRVVGGEVPTMFNTLIYYNAELSGWTPALENGHHSKEDLLKGMDHHTVAEIMWQMLAGDDIVVAYNALFDVRTSYHMFRRIGANAEDFADNVSVLDPLTIVRDRIGGKHSLSVVCRHYGIDIGDAHSAHDDVLATVELLKVLQHERDDIMDYVNVIGYKRQYGEPIWVPKSVTLKPQGNETVYHSKDGTVTKTSNVGKPFQRVVMGKPVKPAEEPRTVEDMTYDLTMGLRNAILEGRAQEQPEKRTKPMPPDPNAPK